MFRELVISKEITNLSRIINPGVSVNVLPPLVMLGAYFDESVLVSR